MNPFGLTILPALLIPLVLAFVLPACTSGASSAPAQPQLSGTQWSLVSFGPPDQQSPVAPSTKLTLVFEGGDGLSGSAGCNNYSGSYIVDGNKLTINQLASTLRACADPDLMAQETRYLTALRKASVYELDKAGSTLKIDYDGGTLNFARDLRGT